MHAYSINCFNASVSFACFNKVKVVYNFSNPNSAAILTIVLCTADKSFFSVPAKHYE